MQQAIFMLFMPVCTYANVQTKKERTEPINYSALEGAKLALDNLEQARQVLNAVDLYKGLRHTVSKRFGGQLVTNAWLKMYELLVGHNLIPKDAKKIRVFCNAELPGAFLAAINHYVRTVCPKADFDWRASSFVSGDVTTLHDQFGLWKCNRDRWLMNAQMNGDVTKECNLQQIQSTLSKVFSDTKGCTLYTSDAGIDLQGDFMGEESKMADINVGQVVWGLSTLAPGGALVVKHFSFANKPSIKLIGWAASFFEEFYISKPRTSRAANSEVYLVGKGFRGLSEPLPMSLDDAMSVGCYQSIKRAAEEIHLKRQVAALEDVATLASGPRLVDIRALRRVLAPLESDAVKRWLSDNPLLPLPRTEELRCFDNARESGNVEKQTSTKL